MSIPRIYLEQVGPTNIEDAYRDWESFLLGIAGQALQDGATPEEATKELVSVGQLDETEAQSKAPKIVAACVRALSKFSTPTS